MYEAFYGFREKPFHVTADPSFLYPSHHHQEAMAHLTYGIQQRLGFLVITGEVGTGKTTLAKTLLNQMPDSTRTALVLNPALSATQLLLAIARDFVILPREETKSYSRGQLIGLIETFLLKEASLGRCAVLIIDEAQALSTSALEQVRLLSAVETPKAKLLQIVLVGQQELSQRLTTDSRLRALNDRVAVRYHIQPLTTQEVGEYIAHRLAVAGAVRSLRFTEGAAAMIARLSSGVPRRVNRLCDQALLAGFIEESFTIDERIVEKVRREAVTGRSKAEESDFEKSLQGGLS
jgi:general secretion pathway protein A